MTLRPLSALRPIMVLVLGVALTACSVDEYLGPRSDAGAGGRPDSSGSSAHDSGDHFSDCVLGGDDCEPGERCASGRIVGSGGDGYRCTSEPGELDEGAPCALDVRVSFPDGAAYDTSRCADELVCAVGTGTTGTCVRPCHLLGCPAGGICVGYWEPCRPAVACDPDTHAPCAEGERCDHVTPIGTAAGQWICAPTGDGVAGDACMRDIDCTRALGCLGGRCTTACDPEWRPTSPGEEGSVPLVDGGALRPPLCADGAMCVPHDRGGALTYGGLCQSDFFSDCELDGSMTCAAGERCAWGRVDGRGDAGTRCVSESGTLAIGDACTLDLAVAFDDGWSYRTSRCGEGLACSVGLDGVTGACVAPCDALGCDAGELCPGAGEACIADVRCDLDTEVPCGADERCAHVVPYGSSMGVRVCRVAGDVGDACGSDDDCQRALGCTGAGICAETCDPTWRPVPAGSDGATPLPDGGSIAPGRCSDGSLCVEHTRRDGTRTGLCERS